MVNFAEIQVDTQTLQVTRPWFEQFKQAYEKCAKQNADEFELFGNTFTRVYASYLVEFLEHKFRR